MKALTYHQPWATATALGWKGLETRGWATAYRGPLLIHAGQTVDREFLAGLVDDWPEWVEISSTMPTGAIVARVRLVEVLPAPVALAQAAPTDRIRERYLGDFREGRSAFVLRDIEPVPEPVECRGLQGLWTVPIAVEDAVRAQIGDPWSAPSPRDTQVRHMARVRNVADGPLYSPDRSGLRDSGVPEQTAQGGLVEVTTTTRPPKTSPAAAPWLDVDPMARWGHRGPYKGQGGGHTPMLWTPKRCRAALAQYVELTTGPLPGECHSYGRMKKGKDLPTAARVLEHFGAISLAWLAAGAPKHRLPLLHCGWPEKDVEYLLANAGIKTLEAIGKHLHRSPGACRRRLHQLGTKAKHNQGYVSAEALAKVWGVNVDRIYKAIRCGEVPATKPAGIVNRWDIDLEQIPADVSRRLKRPRARGESRSYSFEEVEFIRYGRSLGIHWAHISIALGRWAAGMRRRLALGLARRPLWSTIRYTVMEYGGRAAIVDLVTILEDRGVLLPGDRSYAKIRRSAAGRPGSLRISGGVVSIVRWTSRRTRPSQWGARMSEATGRVGVHARDHARLVRVRVPRQCLKCRGAIPLGTEALMYTAGIAGRVYECEGCTERLNRGGHSLEDAATRS